MKKGKLIVFEGGDGSGKTTQSSKLVKTLKRKNIPHSLYAFPRYKSFYGKIIARFLRGELCGFDKVSPYLISLPYALDRKDIRDEMISALDEDKIIVVDRYTVSNMAHQAARIPASEREQFFSWIEEFEYKKLKLPKPDLTILLDMRWDIGYELTKKIEHDRGYINSLDINEKDKDYRRKVEQMYRFLARRGENWITIKCVEEGKLLSIDKIHEKIFKSLNKTISL